MHPGDYPLVIDGLPILPVFINGSGPYGFIFDTGSSGSAIASHIVRDLSLPVSGGGAILRTLRVGGSQWTNFPLGVGDAEAVARVLGRPVDGMLGGAFMKWAKLRITIDYPRSAFSLEPAALTKPDGAASIRIAGYYPIVPTLVNKTGPHPFLLDTGASCCTVSPALAKQLSLPLGESCRLRGVMGSDPSHETRLGMLAAAGIERPDLPAWLEDCSRASDYAETDVQGYLGHSFLKELVMSLDYVGQWLMLKY